MADNDDESEEACGAECPFCKKPNIVYEGKTCPHYGGYLNMGEEVWEFDDGCEVMQKVGEKITAEFTALQERLEEIDAAILKASPPEAAKLKKEQEKLEEIVNDGDGLAEYQSKRLKEVLPKAEYGYDDDNPYYAGPKDPVSIPMIFIDAAGQKQAREYLKSK